MSDLGEGSRARPLVRMAFATGLAVVLIGVGIVVLRRAAGDGGVGSVGGRRPNILVIMSDDQTLESMRFMPRTNRLIGEAGTTLSHYYVSFPNCCPSRATYLTGQYAHNNGVRDNILPLGGWSKLKADETLPVWLQRAGYSTAHIGKYLNTWGSVDTRDSKGQGDITPPPGYDHWFGLIDPTTYNYFDYAVSLNGKRYQYGSKPEDYQTDILGQEVVNTVTRLGGGTKPWFVSFTPVAPHTGGGVESGTNTQQFWYFPVPAPRHDGVFKNERVPRGPSWNEADVSKKPKAIRDQKPIDANFDATEQEQYRKEAETLQALDEWVEKIVDALKATGQLDNTIIMYMSDNGYFHGEHRIAYGKVKLYEEATHLPFMIRGPGIPADKVAPQFAGNVDLAPTIEAIAGATPAIVQDGRDIMPLVKDPTVGLNRALLLENWTSFTTDQVWAIRGGQWQYTVWSNGDRELYDMDADPSQVNNLIADPAYTAVIPVLDARLNVLKTCMGATCEDSDASRKPR